MPADPFGLYAIRSGLAVIGMVAAVVKLVSIAGPRGYLRVSAPIFAVSKLYPVLARRQR